MCGKADKKNAQAVSRAMVDLLLGAKALSVTPDRGKEFARHADVTEWPAVLFSATSPAVAKGLQREY